MLGDALNYIGGSLEKPGRAVRGLLTGNLREGLAAVPFSDSLGITNPSQRVTGRNLTDKIGLTRTGDKGWGSWIAGGAADMATDPLSYIPMGSVFGGLKMGSAAEHGLTATPARAMMSGAMAPLPVDTTAMRLGSKVNDASRPRRFSLDPARRDYYAQSRSQRFADRLGFGNQLTPETRSMISPSLGLKYDNLAEPPAGMPRSAPEWVNNKTFYHGTGVPGMSPSSLDPMKTSADNLFGRGIYTTDNKEIAKSYINKGLTSASDRMYSKFNSGEVADRAWDLAGSGALDDLIRKATGSVPFSSSARDMTKQKSNQVFDMARRAIKYPGYASEHEKNALAMLMPAASNAPVPSLYQANSNFGNILDIEHRMNPAEYNHLFDAMEPVARNIKSNVSMYDRPSLTMQLMGDSDMAKYSGAMPSGDAQSPKLLLNAIKKLGQYSGHYEADLGLRGLRDAGYDALTHTGGVATNSPIHHQVVIGLDPNDVLGLGRKTPYKRWEQVNGSRKPSASVLDSSNNGASSALHSGTGSQPGGAGLSTSIRHLPSDSKATRIGEAQPLFKDNDVGNQHVHAMTKQLLDNLPGLNVAEPHAAVMRSDVRNMIQRLGDAIDDKMEHGGTHHNASLTYEKVPWDKVNQRGDYRYPSDALSEVVKGGGHLPPVQVSRDEAGQLHLLDGHHRGRAYDMAGQKVPAWVGQLHDATPDSNSLIEFLKDESGKLTLGSGQQSGAGLSTRLRSLREDIPVFKPGGRVVGRGDWAGDLSKAGQVHQKLEGSGELLGANVPPWFKGSDLVGDAAGTAGIYGGSPSVAREELMHAMTSKVANGGHSVRELPMMARPAAHMYRAANATGSRTLRGLGSIADELSAKTLAQRTTRGKLGAALDFLLSPEAHQLYDSQFAAHGFIPRAAYHGVPLAAPAAAGGAAGYALTNGE